MIKQQLFTCLICLTLMMPGYSAATYTDTNYITVSQSLLYAVRTEDDSAVHYMQQLAGAAPLTLQKQLITDKEKTAFWLNIYNTYVQWLLKKNPDRYKSRNAFFTSRQITIAGRQLSLDDIEHGILRRSKVKWGLGHLNKLFPSEFEKMFRVQTVDYRIHFALNCGAKSCPPIAYYEPERLDQQLDLATKNYLRNEGEYKAEKNVAYLPAIMGWFRGDFGGKKGMKKLLAKTGIVPEGTDPKIKFKKYDWTLFLDNYKTDANE